MITFGLPHSFAVSRSSSPQHSWHLSIHVCVCLVLWADCPISYRTTIIIPMTISYWTSDGVTHSNVSAGTCRLLLAETSLFSFLIQFRIIHIIVLSYYNGNIFFFTFCFYCTWQVFLFVYARRNAARRGTTLFCITCITRVVVKRLRWNFQYS